MSALTQRDLENALLDERHLGYGYRASDRLRRTEAMKLDTLVVERANELGLDYEDLLAWANSKEARWLAEGYYAGHEPTAEQVARALDARTVTVARRTEAQA